MSFSPVSEVKVVASLTLLYVFRMLGLFMVLPVLMLYGDSYTGSSPFLLGLALGIYGFTQACLQIPLGMLSDIWGRRPVIFMGLAVFAAGSVLAATADTVYELIAGRALQGAGAIASAIMALLTDLTSEENRTKAMAAIGASIGVSFAVALVLGPVLAGVGGMAAVFGLSAALATVGLLIVWKIIPDPPPGIRTSVRESITVPGLLGTTLAHRDLLRLDWGIFCLHFVLMASFVAVPGVLESFNFHRDSHWQVYLPVMLLAFIAMLPFMVVAERKRRVKPVFIGAVALLLIAQFGLAQWYTHLVISLLLLFVFFMAFNLLEATLPSLVSKWAPAGGRGTAMGIYSTSQFMGAFVGGLTGGLAAQHWGTAGVFASCGLVVLVWWVVSLRMRTPPNVKRLKFQVQTGAEAAIAARSAAGVNEAVWDDKAGLLHLKVDENLFDRDQFIAQTGASAPGGR